MQPLNTVVYFLLGSNLGNPITLLAEARSALTSQFGALINISSVYKSSPWGKIEQPDFYNQVVTATTPSTPLRILEAIQQIEYHMGRIRSERWGPRTIDIDILYIGSQIINSPQLMVPHPSIAQRRFTLVPLAEIAPDLIHPVLKKSSLELLANCEDPLPVDRVA